MKRIAAILAVLAALVGGVLVVSRPLTSDGAVRIVLDDTHFSPNRLDAKVGVPLAVELVNEGMQRHDFAIPSLHMPGLHGFETSAAPGQTTTFTLQFDAPGTHEFLCPLAGETAAGMTGAVFVSP